jgi:AcrR family transcriptional regulator
MADVAAEAGLTKPALYASFPNKSALADALTERIALELGREIALLVREDRPLREIVREMVDIFCAFVDRDPELYRFLVQGAAGLGRRFQDRRLVVAAGQLTTFGLRMIMERTGSDPSPAATWGYATVGALFYTLDWWAQTKEISRESLVDHLADAAWAVMAQAGADRLEGPLIPASQASIFVALITNRKDGAQG